MQDTHIENEVQFCLEIEVKFYLGCIL